MPGIWGCTLGKLFVDLPALSHDRLSFDVCLGGMACLAQRRRRRCLVARTCGPRRFMPLLAAALLAVAVLHSPPAVWVVHVWQNLPHACHGTTKVPTRSRPAACKDATETKLAFPSPVNC